MPDDDLRVLSLLRTKGLSIRSLDEESRRVIRSYLVRVHLEQGVSLSDIALQIGNKSSGYTSWLCRELGVKARPFEEARLKGIREKRRKYERKPFDGTEEDRGYLLGLREGDLSASRPFNGAVRVSTSTTHPAMVALFRRLFEGHGHVYLAPRFQKETLTYEWNISTILDASYDFMIPKFPVAVKSLESDASRLAYLAGLFDAEGSVGIFPSKKLTAIVVAYYNTNLELMNHVYEVISSMGFRPIPPYLDKKKGFRSPGYHIEMKKDYWRVLLARFDECKDFLRILPLRHEEKRDKKTLALSLTPGQSWELVGPRVESLRASIRHARDLFVADAQRDYLSRPHKKLGSHVGAS